MGKIILKNFWLYLSILAATNFLNAESTCNHRHPRPHEVLSPVRIESHHVMKKRSVDQPLRILLWYDESVYRLSSEQFELINNTILPQAVHFWEKALYVRKVEEVIRLTRKCNETQVFIKDSLTHCIDACDKTMCGEVQVPEEHLDACRVCNATGQNCGVLEGSKPGEGIKGFDFVFYVSAMQTERCNKSLTVAYAAHCWQEIALDRPIAGHTNLCPNNITTKVQDQETLLSTVKHEILHALGFSVSLYAFYRDENGNPLTPRRPDTGKPILNEKLQTYQWSDRVMRTVKRKKWLVRSGVLSRDVQMIVTPQVVREVRRHFNCSQLEGAELENQGEEGTALTHWEKRVFENEAMTGTLTQNPIISRITLALMEDTGWYRANYDMAESLAWGRNLGCDFVMKSCREWISMKAAKGQSIHPFCNKVKRDLLQTECTDDRTSVALCNLVRYDHQLPKLYQNFHSIEHVDPGTEAFYGGSVVLADYCPYIQEITWLSKNVIVRGSHCQYEENNPHPNKNFAFEKYGRHSKCFDHTDKIWEERSCKQLRQWQLWGSGCYDYKCEAGRLHIIVGNYTYTCYHSRQELNIKILTNNEWLHKGGIVCPPCNELCKDELAAKNESCKLGEEPPPSTSYPYDELLCNASSITMNFFALCLTIFITSIR